MNKLPSMGDDPKLPDRLTDAQARAAACALVGHPLVHQTTDGRFQCRCGQNIAKTP